VARVRKDCPACGSLQPVELALHPLGTPEAPSTKVEWRARCKTCDHVHAPDGAEQVLHGRLWGKAIKARHGSMLKPDGTLYTSTD